VTFLEQLKRLLVHYSNIFKETYDFNCSHHAAENAVVAYDRRGRIRYVVNYDDDGRGRGRSRDIDGNEKEVALVATDLVEHAMVGVESGHFSCDDGWSLKVADFRIWVKR